MKEKCQSILRLFPQKQPQTDTAFALAAILLPIVVNNSYVLGICIKILLYMLLASSVNVINGYSGQFAIGHGRLFVRGRVHGSHPDGARQCSVLSCHAGCRGDDRPVRNAGFLSHRQAVRHLSGLCHLGLFGNRAYYLPELDLGNRRTYGHQGNSRSENFRPLLAVLARVLLYYLRRFGHYGFLHQPHSEIPHRACVDLQSAKTAQRQHPSVSIRRSTRR